MVQDCEHEGPHYGLRKSLRAAKRGTGLPDWQLHGQFQKIWPFLECACHKNTFGHFIKYGYFFILSLCNDKGFSPNPQLSFTNSLLDELTLSAFRYCCYREKWRHSRVYFRKRLGQVGTSIHESRLWNYFYCRRGSVLHYHLLLPSISRSFTYEFLLKRTVAVW